ncbi:MAG: phenylalanine--tRNA ligase subunit alpha [Actinobacteria bacterium]|nr:phenylalanine--tRNA ligase subunit alpha [Actinomycetota bacterium]
MSGTSQESIAAEIATARSAGESSFFSSADLEELKVARQSHLGEKSPISKISQSLGSLDPSLKAPIGKALGEARNRLTEIYEERLSELTQKRDQEVIENERVDVTLPLRRTTEGGIHPLTLIDQEIADIFIGLGYRIMEGPELEASWLNFDALNIPADHPARTMQDTFFIEPIESNLVLRTHTSPTQIRTMLGQQPPIYVICPGRTFRADELDATHTPVFSQVEGLVVDEGISMADLKGTLDYFAKQIFGDDVVARLRPSYFPFTEPSAEVDIFFNDRWIEWGGCGMVNPRVLETCGIDTDKYSGFAFGMGLERTLMVRHQVTDIRAIVEGDVRFTQKFGMGGR